jgi:general secretion pathway protein G
MSTDQVHDGWNPRTSLARGGFTLIELLLVMVILAVLAAIVVPRFTKRSEDAKITAARTQISNFETALGTLEVDCGRFPTNEEALQALIQQPPNMKDWKRPYMDRIPADPWGNPYQYRSPGQHNASGVDIWSFGPDGQDGGGDDIDNWTDKK